MSSKVWHHVCVSSDKEVVLLPYFLMHGAVTKEFTWSFHFFLHCFLVLFYRNSAIIVIYIKISQRLSRERTLHAYWGKSLFRKSSASSCISLCLTYFSISSLRFMSSFLAWSTMMPINHHRSPRTPFRKRGSSRPRRKKNSFRFCFVVFKLCDFCSLSFFIFTVFIFY